MQSRSFLLLLLTVALSLFTACGQTDDTLIIFSATSLTDAQEEMASVFAAEHPDINIQLNFASSSTLATQIIEGAKADLFASANILQMERIAEAGLLHEEAETFASNRVVLIVPSTNPKNIQGLADLTAPGLRIILALPGTPIRAYTDHLLSSAAADQDGEYLNSVLANVRSEEATVRLVLSKVVLGEADAAFVYLSDITAEVRDEIAIIATPVEYQSEIVYPVAILDEASPKELAASYIEFMLSPVGQSILAKWGFVPVSRIEN
ncbi:MAG: molybdate ABC transporter substrate-binding protein [Chloroflexi bacterium]|nr:molybdate ABC transporter substrate-binding protein [Chloroflexota bacterium]